MYDVEGLKEICRRASLSFEKLLAHCKTLTPEEFNRKIDGFGSASVMLQLHHIIGAQKYWFSVLEGRIDVDEDPESGTVDEMVAYYQSVRKAVEQHLQSTTSEALTTPRVMMTWGNVEKELVPVHIIFRTITHQYHHMGQIMAMCRIMGKPVEPGMDYPIIA